MEILIKISFICLAMIITSSCSSDEINIHDFSFNVGDDMLNKKFILSLVNEKNYALCLSPAAWPNSNGTIPITSAKIYVSIDGKEFPLQTFMEDCPDCVFRVEGKNKITGYINYDAFGITGDVMKKAKDLHLTPYAVRC